MGCIFLFFPRWPKWRPSGPSPRTPTILDHVLSPTQPSRENWSLPSMAAGYSSGTGEAAPVGHHPKPWALSKNIKTTCDHWHISYTPKGLMQTAPFFFFLMCEVCGLVLDRAHVLIVSSSAVPPASSNTLIKAGQMDCVNKVHESYSFPDHFCKCNKWTNATCCYCCCQIKR